MQKKVEGQEITMAEAPEQGAQVIDLMEALRASLEKKPAKKAAPAARSPSPPRGRPPRNSVHQFGVREVEKLLRLPRSTIRALVEAGFVTPGRGPRNSLRFSFQDLIVLRTAQALAAAQVPARRIMRSLKELRRSLPEAMPLSGLSINAVGDRVVAEGASRWQAESGQYLLAFEGDPAAGGLKVIEPKAERLRRCSRTRSIRASNCTKRDASPTRKRSTARRSKRTAPTRCSCTTSAFSEDMQRKPEAIEAYRAALHVNPMMADGYYNLALLCEELGKAQEAIRHMAQYRRLTAAKSDGRKSQRDCSNRDLVP